VIAWVSVPFHVSDHYHGKRLDVFLASRLRAVSRTEAQRLIRVGRVLRDEGPVKASSRVEVGEKVRVLFVPTPVEAMPTEPLSILFEDEHLIALDKPPGVLVHPSLRVRIGALTEMMARQRPELSPKPVHRLDKETSGVVLFAKTTLAARLLGITFEQRRLRKEYLALVRGQVGWEKKWAKACFVARRGREGRQEIQVDGISASTELKRLGADQTRSLVLAIPHTGRFHQIRAHLNDLGHPLVGEKIYNPDPEGAPRHMLHARSLSFEHPMSGKKLDIKAPVPADFRTCAGLGLSSCF